MPVNLTQRDRTLREMLDAIDVIEDELQDKGHDFATVHAVIDRLKEWCRGSIGSSTPPPRSGAGDHGGWRRVDWRRPDRDLTGLRCVAITDCGTILDGPLDVHEEMRGTTRLYVEGTGIEVIRREDHDGVASMGEGIRHISVFEKETK